MGRRRRGTDRRKERGTVTQRSQREEHRGHREKKEGKKEKDNAEAQRTQRGGRRKLVAGIPRLRGPTRQKAAREGHEATWLAWPHELTDWPGKFAPIPWAFAEIVRHLTRVERVFLLVENRQAEARVRTILRKAGAALEAVEFFRVATDRVWLRDSGPICVKNA